METFNNNKNKICIDSIEFIGGDFQELMFAVFDETTEAPIDLSNFKDLFLIIYPYGDVSNPSAIIDGFYKFDETNVAVFEITSQKTENFFGLYQYQLSLIDEDGIDYRPAYGNINIIQRSYLSKG